MNNLTDIILENEGLIYKIINKYKNYFELDDLYQVAVLGLIKAYNNYNNTYNTKFTSYAYPYILGEVIKYLNEYRNIKLPKNTKILYSKIIKAKEILSQKLMKEPNTYELSLFLEIDEKIIDEVLLATSHVESLDKIISSEDNNLSMYDKLGYFPDEIENYPLRYELEHLNNREKQLIKARYYEDKTQQETSKYLGMYQVEVSRNEKKILQKLKDNILR